RSPRVSEVFCMINCRKTEEVINEIAREQIMDTSVRDTALAHCEICSVCRKRLDEQQALTAILQGLAENMRSIEAAPVVSAHLTAALRERVVAPSMTRHRRAYVLAGIAAVLLISFVLGALSLNLRRGSVGLTNTAKNPESPVEPVAIDKPTPPPDKAPK